ncbi:MAG: AsmA family protein [Nitrospinae bacterium]|nr:AsmA family protein [Nitrospinota bacterium]
MPLSRKIISSIFIILFLVALSLSYILYVQLNDLDNIKGIVLSELKKATQREISIGTAMVSLTEGLGLELKDVVLYSKSGGSPDFKAQRFWVVFRLLPLLRSEIEIKKIVVEGSSFEITRDAQGTTSLRGLQDLLVWGRDEVEKEVDLKVLFDQIVIRGGSLRFVDYQVSSTPDPFILDIQDIDLTLSKGFLDQSIQFVLEGNLANNDKVMSTILLTGKLYSDPNIDGPEGTSINGKLRIEELVLNKIEPYLDKVFAFVPKDSWLSGNVEFSGTLDGRLKTFGELIYSANGAKRFAVFKDPLKSSRGTIKFENTFNKDSVIFQKLNYHSGSFTLEAVGGFSNFLSENPLVYFAVRSSEFRVNKTQDYLPFMLFHKETHRQVQERFQAGTVEIKLLKFDGSLDQLNNLSDPENLKNLSANLYLKEVDLGEPWPRLQKITGSMLLKNGEGIVSIRRAQYKDFQISNLSGRVVDMMNDPVVDWTVQGDLDLGQLSQTLKSVMSKTSYERLLGQYRDIKGTGVALIHFQGPLSVPDKLMVDGELEIVQTSFKQDAFPSSINEINGKILFHRASARETENKENYIAEPWDIKFKDFSGNFGAHSFSELGGELTLVGDEPLKRVRGKFKLGFMEAAQLISDSFDANLYSFLQDLQFLGGDVLLDYSSEGNPLVRKSLSRKGTLELINLSFNHKEGYQPLSGISGVIQFDNKRVSLETTSAWYGSSPVRIIGEYLNTPPGPIRYRVQIISDEFLNEDFKGIPVLETLGYEGPAKLNFDWKGRGDSLSFNTQLDLSPVSYRYKDIFSKTAGASNQIKVVGRMTREGTIFIDNLTYQLGKNKVIGNAQIKSLDDPEYTVSLSSDRIDLHLLLEFIKLPEGPRGGTVKFKVSGKGNLNKLNESSFRGTVGIQKVVFQPKDFSKPLILSADLQFFENNYKINKGKLASDKSRIIFSGFYSEGDNHKLRLKVSGPALYLEELMPDTETDILIWLREFKPFSKGSGIIEISLDRFNYDFLQLKKMVGTVSFKDGKVDVPHLQFGTKGDNLVQIQGKFALEDADKVRFESTIVSRHITTKGFLDSFGDIFANSLTGRLNLFKASLKGHGGNWKEVTQNLDGEISLDLKGGKINTARLQDGTIKLFNIKSEDEIVPSEEVSEDTPFRLITGNFTISKGLAKTENFQYETVENKMSLVGEFDLNKFEMDTIVGVAPLRVLDRLVQKIPVFGRILTGGDEESLFKTYYIIKGSFEDPEVTGVPFTSLGKRVVGIIQGILESPADIFSPQILGEPTN